MSMKDKMTGNERVDIMKLAEAADTSMPDLAGAGEWTETVKGNADAITDLAGAGRVDETVKAMQMQ